MLLSNSTQIFEASKSGRRSSSGQAAKAKAAAPPQAAQNTSTQPTAASIVAQSISAGQQAPSDKKAQVNGASPKSSWSAPPAKTN